MKNYFLRSATDWLFRRRSPALALIRAGSALLLASLVGFTIAFKIPTNSGPLTFDWSTSGGSTEVVSAGVAVIGAVLILVGLGLLTRELKRDARKKVVVIEARGLRDWQGTPLELAVPPSILGRREPLTLDVRQGLVDGQIVDPGTAARRIMSIRDDLSRRWAGFDRRDLTYVVGGVAPVPFLFLLGVLLDDEGGIVFMDWDRHSRIWRHLDADDDLKRFVVDGLDQVPSGQTRVALCVSASYDILAENVALAEPDIPVVRMDLEGRGTDSHWSEQKQRELAREFLAVVMKLAANGIQEITLFLAAPASLALRFGTLYDKRNLPRIEVNQYEQGSPKKFPWAVRMPVSGLQDAAIGER